MSDNQILQFTANNIDPLSTPLKDAVKAALAKYFITLDGATASNVYQLVMTEIEKPLLETVMQHAEHNQSKAAKWLGLSRNTLRKLLAKYGIGE